MNIRLLIILISLMMLYPIFAFSQSIDEMLQMARKERNRLYRLTEDYKNNVRQMWLDHICQPWINVEAQTPLQRPKEDYPNIPVMPLISYDYDVGETFEIPATILVIDKSMYTEEYFSAFPVYEEVDTEDNKVVVPLNGFELLIRFPDDGKVALSNSSEVAVASAMAQMACIAYGNTLSDLTKAREVLSLSDWSYIRLVDRLSAVVYGSNSSLEAVLLQSYILGETGFNLCLGRDSDGELHKLLQTDANLFDRIFYLHNDSRFYLLENTFGKHMSMDMIDIPSFSYKRSKRPMRMRMNPQEKFHMSASKPMKFAPSRYPNLYLEVRTDMSRMDFYSDYPVFYTDGGPLSAYYHYAMIPLSDEVKRSVYPLLRYALEGKSELESVNILMNLVQTSFSYVRDVEEWGTERYFFPDELWCYGKGDCEDKCILFSRLVRDLLGMPVALVYWHGHLSCAVAFSGNVKGAYFNVESRRFVSCDPTYENAYAGAIMDEYKTQNAKLILLP